MSVYKEIIDFLDEFSVDYKTYEHEFVHKSEDAARTRGTKLEEAAKALVLKTKSGKFFMLIVPGNMKASLKTVKAMIGEKNVSLASPEEVLKITGLKIGSVPPFGQFFNLKTYFEEKLLEQEKMVFSAGSHYKSIRMKTRDFVKVLDVEVANFSEVKDK